MSRREERTKLPKDFETTISEISRIHKDLERDINALSNIILYQPDLLDTPVYRDIFIRIGRIGSSVAGLLQEEEKADLLSKYGSFTGTTNLLNVLNFSNSRDSARTIVLLCQALQLSIFVHKRRYDRLSESPVGKDMIRIKYIDKETSEVREIEMPKAMYELSESVRFMLQKDLIRIGFILETSYGIKLQRILTIQQELKRAELAEERFVPSPPPEESMESFEKPEEVGFEELEGGKESGKESARGSGEEKSEEGGGEF